MCSTVGGRRLRWLSERNFQLHEDRPVVSGADQRDVDFEKEFAEQKMNRPSTILLTNECSTVIFK
jgi:hypothetical protein